MKKYLHFIVVIILTLVITEFLNSQPRASTNRDQAILCEAEAVEKPTPKIILKWVSNELVSQYIIFRKAIDDQTWGYAVATLDSTKLSWEDVSVVPGIAYEYKISGKSFATFHYTLNGGKDTAVVDQFYAYGYVCAGIDVALPDNFGKVIILYDKTIWPSLSTEITQLKQDMISEGWQVVLKETPRAETFDGTAVKAVKKLILDEYNNSPDTTKISIFIIGRVPVPYSGNFGPDAHPDHQGAWPADMYYGSIIEDRWTDVSVTSSGTSRDENKNVPGDGKFDQSDMSGDQEVFRIGRVDFYNMPVFTKNEIELLRSYLNKNHKYRIGLIPTLSKCDVSDNFQSYAEGFATSGWRTAPLVGKDNVTAGDFFTSIAQETHIWSYGTGGGWPEGAGGVGTSADFASKKPQGIFTMLFGSYFGDWDQKNDFLRACIASDPSILTCSWSGRPQWYYHHMGIGLPIGYSTVITENNISLYMSNYFYQLGKPAGQNTFGNFCVHQALMGDPTLRMYMYEQPAAPKGLTITKPYAKPVKINWDQVFDDIAGYEVYRSLNPDGPFVKISDAPTTNLYYSDDFKYEGQVYYMVKSVKLQKTFSGSFLNKSAGTIANVYVTGVNDLKDSEFSLSCTPNPAFTNTNLLLTLPAPELLKVEIFDVRSNLVKSLANDIMSAGSLVLSWDLTDTKMNRVVSGVYFAKITMSSGTKIVKIIVMP